MNMSTSQLPARTGQNQGAIAKAAAKPSLEALFAARHQDLAEVAADGMSVQRLYRTMMLCVQKTPAIGACTAESLYRCMMDAAEVGLEPGGALGLAYLVPYNDTKSGEKRCEYQIGYRGYIELARRSGVVSHVHPVAVYKGDGFEYEMGLKPILRHKPGIGTRSAKDLTHAYAIAHFKDGPAQFDVMTRGEIDAIMARSKTSQSGPWQTDYAEMAKKTVLRRICKVLPRSIAVKDNLSVASDGRVHRIEPVGRSVDAEFRPDMTDDEFESAAPGPVGRVAAPRGPSDAEVKAQQEAEEARLRAALTVEAARIWSTDDYDLTPDLASKILDKPVTDVAADWEQWGVRDFVRILCYAMHQGRTIPLTEEIPDPAAVMAEAQAFRLDAQAFKAA
jgi:recombination protein RecT